RANCLARYLRRRGVTRGSLVGMLLPRSLDAYALILGILKAGAAYVPIDPKYPEDRIAYILQDSGARVLVTNDQFARRPLAFDGDVISTDRDQVAIGAETSDRLSMRDVGVSPRAPCYV